MSFCTNAYPIRYLEYITYTYLDLILIEFSLLSQKVEFERYIFGDLHQSPSFSRKVVLQRLNNVGIWYKNVIFALMFLYTTLL